MTAFRDKGTGDDNQSRDRKTLTYAGVDGGMMSRYAWTRLKRGLASQGRRFVITGKQGKFELRDLLLDRVIICTDLRQAKRHAEKLALIDSAPSP